MRVLVASAAIAVAAAVPSMSTTDELADCRDRLRTAPAIAAAVAPIADITPGTLPELGDQSQPTELPEQVEVSAPDLCATLIEAAESNDLPPAFLARLIWRESRFDPTSLSSAGAQGIAQFMPRTAIEVGLSNPWDPIEAVPASARLLSKLRSEFGNLGLAAGAYNAGSGRMREWLTNRQSLPKETQDYIRIITGQTAENWTEHRSRLTLATRLPRGVPCTEIASAGDSGELPMTVSLTREIANLIETAKAERLAEARRRKLARTLHGRRGKTMVARGRHGDLRVAAKSSKRLRLASAR
jgi:Transglycosylase SLT domain